MQGAAEIRREIIKHELVVCWSQRSSGTVRFCRVGAAGRPAHENGTANTPRARLSRPLATAKPVPPPRRCTSRFTKAGAEPCIPQEPRTPSPSGGSGQCRNLSDATGIGAFSQFRRGVRQTLLSIGGVPARGRASPSHDASAAGSSLLSSHGSARSFDRAGAAKTALPDSINVMHLPRLSPERTSLERLLSSVWAATRICSSSDRWWVGFRLALI